jgi:DNA modification methylase
MEINVIHNENCLTGLKKLPDNSIDCCITSPPYWGLRDYGHEEQLGNEPHFKDFINNLCSVFDEVKRVLKPTGTCFVNLGDSYNTISGRMVQLKNGKSPLETLYNSKVGVKVKEAWGGRTEFVKNYPKKSLFLIPERFAIEMIERGWCLRNQIIWHKPNQMPQSAKDRFTVDFEKIFFFVKESIGYYFEQQLEPYTAPMNRWGGDELKADGGSNWDKGTKQTIYRKRDMRPNKEGKNMRTVWSINTEPFPEAHFAKYPPKLVERMIKAGCPEGGIVLDPFMGTGTTAMVARKLSRNYIGFEINPEYIKMANKRIYKEVGMFS